MNLRTLAVSALAVPAAFTMSAQSVTLRANIPFNFVVNGENLAAGQYSVGHMDPRTLVVRDADRKGVALIVAALAPERVARNATSRLVFHKYGDRYFLYQIWTDNGHGVQVPETKLEREIVARAEAPNQLVAVVLR